MIEQGTRATRGCAGTEAECSPLLTAPPSPTTAAHQLNRLLIQLNPQWRVVDNDLQYILQGRKGRFRSKATGWCCRSYWRTRGTLLRCIREYCGLVAETALEQVHVPPEWHADR